MPCRVSPFGNLRINAYVPLPGAYRSLSRPSSAPDAKAFPLRSYQLDHFWFSIMNYAGHRRISFYRSNCSCYPIIPQYILLTAFAAIPSVALLILIILFVQFSRCRLRSKTGSKRSKHFKRFDPFFDGGDKRDRTADLLRAKQALSHLSYTPKRALVGQSGLEPPTSRLSVVCSSQLSYWPIFIAGFRRALYKKRTYPLN